MRRLRYYIKWLTDYDFRCYIRKVKKMAKDKELLYGIHQYWHKRLQLIKSDCRRWYVEPCAEPRRKA